MIAQGTLNSLEETTIMRIMICEDDEGIREFVSAFLTDEGYDIAIATNGEEALSMIAEQQPSLIFMDVYMPIMDGRTFVDMYRQTPGPHAPVIGMSANLNDTVAASFDGFIAKPFDLEQLLDCINEYCS
jgi:two-component system response regulator MprA